MTDVSTTQTSALISAKSVKSNNEICHSIVDTTSSATTTTAISLTNGSTVKINDKHISTITKIEQHLAIKNNKMSTVGVKSPTPTTQSPATTPSQTLVSYDTNTSVCPTTLITTVNQSKQVVTKPALHSGKDSVSSEAIETASPTTLSPTKTVGGGNSNILGNTTILSSPISSSNPSMKSGTKQLHEASSKDVDEVARLFEEKPEAFEKWLLERAPPEALARLYEFIESRKHPLKRASVTSDLFQQWLSSSPIQKNRSLSSVSSGSHSVLDNRRHLMELDEGELFMELIRDVANELDIDVLCHKILVNVGLLTHADRGSLFLAKGPPNNRYLVAKLFDVTQKTQIYLVIKISLSTSSLITLLNLQKGEPQI